jgi:hypothetical protein
VEGVALEVPILVWIDAQVAAAGELANDPDSDVSYSVDGILAVDVTSSMGGFEISAEISSGKQTGELICDIVEDLSPVCLAYIVGGACGWWLT